MALNGLLDIELSVPNPTELFEFWEPGAASCPPPMACSARPSDRCNSPLPRAPTAISLPCT